MCSETTHSSWLSWLLWPPVCQLEPFPWLRTTREIDSHEPLKVEVEQQALTEVSESWDVTIFFSKVYFLCLLLFVARSTPVLPKWHVKDPGHSAKTASGRLHLNTCTPLTQRSRGGLIMPLFRHSVGTYPETSSHATCQEKFSHSRLSPLSHCGLILALRVELVCASLFQLKKKKKLKRE